MLRVNLSSALAVGLVLSGCAGGVSPTAAVSVSDADFARVGDQSTFEVRVVGREAAGSGYSVTFEDDGSTTGRAPSGAFAGTWTWNRGKVCMAIGSEALFGDQCATPEVAGDVVRFRTDDGVTTPPLALRDGT